MARSALGVHWKDLSAAERAQFEQLFGHLIETIYINRANISEAKNKAQALEVTYVKEISEGDGYSKVNTTVLLSGAEKPVDVSYRLRFEEGNWKVYDVIVAGISLIGNYRNQFNRIINRDGYPALVQDLKNKLDQLQNSNAVMAKDA
jgi:phospholipid transport system substrate-binding protein